MNVPPVISEAFYHGIQWLRQYWVGYHNTEEARAALEKWFALPYVQDHFKMLIKEYSRTAPSSGSALTISGVSGGSGGGSVSGGYITSVTTRTDRLWRCSDGSCPEREPISSLSQPVCYTCNRPMSEVKGV